MRLRTGFARWVPLLCVGLLSGSAATGSEGEPEPRAERWHQVAELRIKRGRALRVRTMGYVEHLYIEPADAVESGRSPARTLQTHWAERCRVPRSDRHVPCPEGYETFVAIFPSPARQLDPFPGPPLAEITAFRRLVDGSLEWQLPGHVLPGPEAILWSEATAVIDGHLLPRRRFRPGEITYAYVRVRLEE